MKFLLLIVKDVGRNPVQSTLTALAAIVFVLVVTLVWSVVAQVDRTTAPRRQNVKVMVTERWSFSSHMPCSYAATLIQGAAQGSGDVRPLDWMSWHGYFGTLDPIQHCREDNFPVIACDPDKVATMMEGLDSLPPQENASLLQAVERLKQKRHGMIVGRDRLKVAGKRVGDRLRLFGLGRCHGLDLEFEIVGVLPLGRYDTLAVMNQDYFLGEIERYPKRHNGQEHPLANGSINVVWLKVRDIDECRRLVAQIESSPCFPAPPVKCETSSSGFAVWVEPFNDLLWALRWLVVPACLGTLGAVLAINASLNVRSRRAELALLKVIGFRPWQILALVSGESLLLGIGSGVLCSVLTYASVNWLLDGLSFRIAFLDYFLIPRDALWWGPIAGGLTALAGSLLPALSACRLKAADVFSRVA
jgi:putative ABC transport system permease protein